MSSAPTSPDPADLGTLVEEWIDWAEAGRRLGVSVSRVRVLIKENQLAAAVPSPGAGQQIPAAFVEDGQLLKGLSGLVVMLTDHGFDHREIIEWLYTDADLPGRPVDALVENRGSEVKRRAQAMH
ncbi:Rv2175c family DNA-binding protein [Nocardioides zeae]|uniref:Rv2175c family DNA-binding protein n=1 Tax=Nocardioides imazamoxiresistens TaxID=3231893 RepID=A0ABU3PZ28_9ACTN|nr:Rv2175c family DNA-binding protein [Nocardioides zeae]MDT9594487.1 Rv2175c family DNA-binding protein [Nocardioides zeae]